MIAETWCADCDQPATLEFKLTTGETVAKCPTHATAIVVASGAYLQARSINFDFDRHRLAAICGVWLQPDGTAIDLWPRS